MKLRAIGILLTIIYVTAMLRPILPVLNYYIDYDYIVAELCENKDEPVLQCNGKCHLAKEIKKANNGIDTQEEIPPLNMKDYPVAPIPNQTTVTQNHFLNVKKQIHDAYANRYTDLYCNSILQPPQAIV